mgnify:CR=1 FL=1
MIRFKQFVSMALALSLASTAAAQGSLLNSATPRPASTAMNAPAASADGAAAQDAGDALMAMAISPDGRALLAMTAPDYPVTPGDVYQLSFISARGVETVSLIVDASMRVNAGVFGVYEARGQRYDAFRKQLEEAAARAYPGSAPQLIIRSAGAFSVLVSGEVQRAGELQAWGLARLSSVVKAAATPFASERAVYVRSADGQERAYDLFKAHRLGDLSHDPYLRPGDRIRLVKAERRVSVSGAVRRPGSYELLPGEGLERLIAYYADGFTETANRDRLSLTRVSGDAPAAGLGERSVLRYGEAAAVTLMHLDSVQVPGLNELRPVAWFEGALGPIADGAALDNANRVPYTFVPGELLSAAVRALQGQFRPSSDLAKAYISRAGGAIPVDLGAYLYDKDFSVDHRLEPGDVIVVPFRQLFVTVSGAVRSPGRYPYIPDRSWEYYVALAGGFDTERNAGQTLAIYDQAGKAQVKGRLIQPEDIIEAKSNSFIYGFGRVAGIIGTTISVASLVISIYSMTR